MKERYELGQLLVKKGLVTVDQLDTCLTQQKQTGKFLGELLIENGFVKQEQLLEALTEQKRADFVTISRNKGVRQDIVRIIPEAISRRYGVIAIALADNILTVAMKDSTDIVAIDTVKRITGFTLRIVRAEENEILENIEKYYLDSEDISKTLAALEEVKPEETAEEEVDVNQLRVAAGDAPIVRFVNSLFLQAVERRATDIHLEPQEAVISLRVRVDGMLRELQPPPKPTYPGIVTRLKILASIDIGERRLPQDGRIRIRVGSKEIDIRMSTLPTIHGEKIVMRLLDKDSLVVDMAQLGFTPADREHYQEALKKPYGIIIVTGPTGSGKTTTLYTGLSSINTPEKNIVTVEDPVEYELKGVNQVAVRPKIGLTFPAVLRTFLRQDPDIIMVGEIRDLETAQIAIHASLTGHLVISTLHTNDTIATISRLSYMGVEPFLLAASVNMILAQRLIRKICPTCKTENPEGRILLEQMGGEKFTGPVFHGKGCHDCEFTGYFGRTAIYEILLITRDLRKMIVNRAPEDDVRAYAEKNGMVSLREAALRKVTEGITTVEEAFGATLIS